MSVPFETLVLREESSHGVMDTLMDLPFGKDWIEQFATMDWLDKFPATKVVHLECGSLDHKPIVICLNGIPSHQQKPWRFGWKRRGVWTL